MKMFFSGKLKILIILMLSVAILIKVNDAANTEKKQDPKCLLPMEPGPCRMSLNRFYYNAETDSCEEFKFGGCKGNDNKFGFKQTCEAACKKSSTSNVASTASATKSSGNSGTTTTTTTERSTQMGKDLQSLTSNVEEATTIKPRQGARTTPKLKSATSRSAATTTTTTTTTTTPKSKRS
ncbi:uncharacterized protein ACRADG_005024 isoform 1-T2 [Cochliomyia hominivorax]